MFKDQIARVAYEANRGYGSATKPPWEEAPSEDVDWYMRWVNQFYDTDIGVEEAYNNAKITNQPFDRQNDEFKTFMWTLWRVVRTLRPKLDKPPTQVTKVEGFDAHKGMGEKA